MLDYIKYIVIIILLGVLLFSGFFTSFLEKLKDFVINTNTNMFSHFNNETLFLFVLLIILLIIAIVNYFRD